MVSVFAESERLLNEARKEILKADYCIEAYVELDSYSEIFEEKNKEIQDQVDKNKNAVAGSKVHTQSALDKIIEALKNMIEHIKVFFMERKMSKEMHKAYEVYKEALKKDPSLKNKTIKVVDVQRFQKEYEEINAKLNAAEERSKRGLSIDLGPLSDLVNSYAAKIKGAAGAVVTSVGMESALKLAEGNMAFAQKVYGQLSNNKAVAEKLKEEIGNHQFNKFKRQMKGYSKDISILSLKARHNQNAARSAEEAISQTINQYMDGVKSIKNILGVMGDRNKETDKYGRPKSSVVGYALRNRKDLKDDIKTATKAFGKTAMRALGNDDAKDLAKQGIQTVSKKSKEKKAMQKAMIKADKYNEKHKNDPRHAPIEDFFTSKNDPNSKVGQVFNSLRSMPNQNKKK